MFKSNLSLAPMTYSLKGYKKRENKILKMFLAILATLGIAVLIMILVIFFYVI